MKKLIFVFLIGFNVYGQHISSWKISRIVKKNKLFSKSHVSIAIQRLGSNKKIKGVQSSKYMTPASNLKILTLARRKGDLVKIIAENKSLMKFINWKPKFDKLKIMVASSLKWEKKK